MLFKKFFLRFIPKFLSNYSIISNIKKIKFRRSEYVDIAINYKISKIYFSVSIVLIVSPDFKIRRTIKQQEVAD